MCRHVRRIQRHPRYLRPRIRSSQLTKWSQFFFFQRSYGWSRLILPGSLSLQGSPRRLKPVDGWSSGSHVCKTNTPFFACSGMRPWTPEMAFLTEATQHTSLAKGRIHFHQIPQCCLCRSLQTLQAGVCGPWLLGMSLGLTCRLHRVVWSELLLSIPTDCRSFYLQGPHIVVLSLSPLMVSNQHLGQSSGFTTDSPAPESTVISRYRHRFSSVPRDSLSMVILSIVTVFRSTSSGHHSSSLESLLDRSSSSLKISYCGVLDGKCWYKPSF